MVGHAALVGLLPLLTQAAQVVLHLAAAQFLARLALQQPFGLGHQFFAQLIGTPALPALQLAGCGQRSVNLALQLVANRAAKLFQCATQRVGSTGTGFAVAFGDFKFKLGQRLAHAGFGLGFDFGVDFGLGGLGRNFHCHTARRAQLVRPLRHGRQGCCRIAAGCHRLRECRLKRIPYHQQLPARGLQQGWKFGIHARPVGIRLQSTGLVLPMRHIHAQGLPHGLGIVPGLH